MNLGHVDRQEFEKKCVNSIREFFSENMDAEIGDLKARLLLDFFMAEIAPSVYNDAIADAHAFIADKLHDLDASCYKPTFAYWNR